MIPPKTKTQIQDEPTASNDGEIREEAGILDLFGSKGDNGSGVGVSSGDSNITESMGTGLKGAGKQGGIPIPSARQYAPMTSLSGNSRSQPIEIQNVSPRYEALKRLSR